jgi:hypothetical protein
MPKLGKSEGEGGGRYEEGKGFHGEAGRDGVTQRKKAATS